MLCYVNVMFLMCFFLHNIQKHATEHLNRKLQISHKIKTILFIIHQVRVTFMSFCGEAI